jgi:transposase
VDVYLRGGHAPVPEELDASTPLAAAARVDKLALMLADHVDGILNHCRVKVRFGVVEAVNGNIKTLLRRGRGYKNLHYLLLNAQRMAVTKTEFVAFRKAA